MKVFVEIRGPCSFVMAYSSNMFVFVMDIGFKLLFSIDMTICSYVFHWCWPKVVSVAVSGEHVALASSSGIVQAGGLPPMTKGPWKMS